MIDASSQFAIDGAVMVGLGIVAPLALGGWRRWAVAGVLAAVALTLPRGVAGGCAALGCALIASLALRHETSAGRGTGHWRRAEIVRALAAVWALVATGALVMSRFGLTLFGIHEPIVELTAVHYLFAGVGALALAGTTRSSVAVVITGAAPPVVALGFVTGWATPQVGGAVLMAMGVFTIAALELRVAVTDRRSPWLRRVLLTISGLAVWAPMLFAVAWAAGQHWAIPALSVPAMIRWHGLPNAIGFVIAGLAAARVRPGREVPACA